MNQQKSLQRWFSIQITTKERLGVYSETQSGQNGIESRIERNETPFQKNQRLTESKRRCHKLEFGCCMNAKDIIDEDRLSFLLNISL